MALNKQKDNEKDVVFFLTKEEQDLPLKPEVAALSMSLEKPEGPILANGDINWSCPCLGRLVGGPCGYEFRQAFNCFHANRDNPEAADCSEFFANLFSCIAPYPDIYGKKNTDQEDESSTPFDVASSADDQSTSMHLTSQK